MFDTKQIKKDFPLFSGVHKELIYLDNAASSQTPRVVLEAMYDYYTTYRANINRGIYPLSEKATQEYEDARAVTASFINALPEEIIFTAGSTMSMNILMQSIEHSERVKKGDSVVTTVAEHHSLLVPLQQFARRRGCVFKFISTHKDYNLNYEEAMEIITPKTKIVSLALASNVLGTINDIKILAKRAHKVGALFIVDAAKAAGHIPINVKELDCDFLFFSGHKMCGPTGIGVLYGKKELLETMKPYYVGGGSIKEVTREETKFADSPFCFESGTPHIAGVVGLRAAIKYLNTISVEKIHAHIQEITAYTIKELDKLKGVRLFCQRDTSKNVGVVSFTIQGIHPHDIGEIVARENIAIRAGHHCAQPLMQERNVPEVARASFFIYNSKSDVDVLVQGIKKAQTIFSSY